MKTCYYLFTLTLLLLFVCLGSLNVLYANGITLEMVKGDRSKLPKGPSPSTLTTYDPSTAETFSLSLTGFADNEYYEISVALSRSNFKGYAANFPMNSGGKYKDLEFLKSDYVQKTTENGKEKTIYPLGWTWMSDTSLSFSITTENNAKPGNIKVRCHDWGANGSVAVTIEKRGDAAYTLTKTVPYDEANKNGIADQWEKDNNIYIADETEAQTKAAEDEEVAPDATNKNNGDGWTNYDEYRGIFTEWTDAQVTRLDPAEKDIIYTMHSNLQSYGLGQLREITKHTFRYVESSFVKTPFIEVYEYATDGVPDHKADIDALTGRINYNSNAGGSWTQVPKAKDVWAIRIMGDTKVRKRPGRFGHATNGSPARYSLIKIFTTNINNRVTAEFNAIDNFEEGVVEKRDTYIANAVNKTINIVIAHEIVHSININKHCNHANCLMRSSTKVDFIADGSYRILKKKLVDNPKPGESEWVNAKTKDGELIELLAPILAAAHLKKLAVTGYPSSGISDCSCVEIGSFITSVPDAPSIFGSLLGDSYVTLMWHAPVSDGGSDILDYEYRYRLASASDFGDWTSAGKNKSEKVSNLTSGTSYTFEVRAKNSVGYSVASSSWTLTMPLPKTVPSAPLSLSATSGDGSVELSWLPPSDDGNSSILRYEYRYGVGASVTPASYTSWTSMGSAVASFPVSPLTNDMFHIFEVRAVNAIGNGAASASASAMPTAPLPPPPTAAPGRPTGLSVVSTSNGVVKVSWTAPENDGGGIDVYEYRVDENNDGSWGGWESLDSSSTSATLNLQNGRTYGIQVRAKNSIGSGTQTAKITAMPIDSSVSVPSAPRNLRATAENGQVRLSWNTPSTGTGIIDYEYRLDTNDDGSWRAWKITDSTSTSYTVPGLTNETLYAFLVRARNAGGAGTQSEKVTATPTNITVPSKPRNLTASLTTDGRIYLDWNAPTDNGGSTITDYEYRYDTHNDGSWRSWDTTHDSGTDEYFTGFTLGVTYAYQIRAVNKSGSGTASDKALITVPDVPSNPLNFTATLQTDGSVYLDWDAPADDGGSAITDYEYGMDTDADDLGELWRSLGDTDTDASLFGSGWTPGATYMFRVHAVNLVGVGTASEQVVITIPDVTTPSAVQYLTADAGNASVYISWSEPADDGYGAMRGETLNYQYRYRQSGGTWSSWSADRWQTDATISSLVNATTYEFEVQAKNDSGTGPTATVSATPTNTAVPGVPTYFDTSSMNGSVDLWWKPPLYDGGSAITDYEYNYRQIGGTWNGWGSAGISHPEFPDYTVTGLTNGTTYEFQIRAKNAIGTSPSSETLSETPKARVPDTPTGVNASAGATAGSIDLTWTAPNDGGSPIIDYEVKYAIYTNGWSWTTFASTSSTTTSYTVTGLQSGETYRFRVLAVNSVGKSRSSKLGQTTAP